MLFQLTTAGRSLVDSNPTGPNLTRVDFGSSFNYSLPTNPTGLAGSLVHSSNTVFAARVADANTLVYTVFLGKEVASFTFGEMALYAGSTLVGVGVASASISKIGPGGGSEGESFRADIFIDVTPGQRYAVVQVATSRIVNSFPRVPIPDQLIPPALNENNAFVIYGMAPTDVGYLAFADPTGKWTFSAKPQVHLEGTVETADDLNITSSDLSGVYEGQVTDLVLQFTSGKNRGYCRQLTDLVTEDGLLSWLTPMLIFSEPGDSFIVVGPQTNTQVITTGQANIQFKDEGNNLGTAGTVTAVDFVGSGITASRSGNTVTVVVDSTTYQAQLQVQNEGVNLGSSGTVSTLNFVGSNVDATRSGNIVTITVSPGTGQTPIQFQDEGTNLGVVGTVDTVNFVGNAVTATRSGNTVTTTINAPSGIQFQDEGSNLGASGTVDTVNIVGAGVSASRSGNTVTITVSNGAQSALQFQDEGTNLGAAGTVDTLNFAGAGVTASRSGNTVTVSITNTGTQPGIQFQQNGTNLGTSGTADTVNISGSGVSGTRSGNTVNYTITTSQGTIGVHAVPIVAGSMFPAINNGCSQLNIVALSNGNSFPDLLTLDFDPSIDQYAQFMIPMPEKWNEGTITWKAIWSHIASTGSFTVSWSLAAVAISPADAFDTNFGTKSTILSTGGTANTAYGGSTIGTLTVAGSPVAGDVVAFQVNRNATSGSDTLAVKARLSAIVLYITTHAETDA